jgi:hypothetical protein
MLNLHVKVAEMSMAALLCRYLRGGGDGVAVSFQP